MASVLVLPLCPSDDNKQHQIFLSISRKVLIKCFLSEQSLTLGKVYRQFLCFLTLGQFGFSKRKIKQGSSNFQINGYIWCEPARLTTLVARSKNGVIWICYMLWSSNFQGISRNYYSFEILKIRGKSRFNLMKTRFDWGRLDFAKNRIFSLWDPIFAVFSAKANKGGYSSHLLQSRILKNVLEPDLPPI